MLLNETTNESTTPVAKSHALKLTPEQVELLRRTVCRGANDDEVKLFLETAQRLGLDPFSKQIHAVKRWSKGGEVLSIQVGIDGFRLQAQRTGQYEGQAGPHWCGEDGEWKDVWLSNMPPAAARVGVWRTGFREPIWAVARWESYKQESRGQLSPMWQRMPDLMLAKCAEALALRRAFPAELSGVYVFEEMGQADNTPAAPHAQVQAQPRLPLPEPVVEPAALPTRTSESDEHPAVEAVRRVFPEAIEVKPPAMATPVQVRTLAQALGKLGVDDKEDRLVWISERVGRDIGSSKELTAEEAETLITSARTEALANEAQG